jgi:hypothetical protein
LEGDHKVAEGEETVIGLVTTVIDSSAAIATVIDRASTIGHMMIDLDVTTVIVMLEGMVVVAVAVEVEGEVIVHLVEVGVD